MISNIHPILKRMYRIKSKFSISPEEMAKVYTALAVADGYSGFLYDEKMKEVRASRFAYDKSAQRTSQADAPVKAGITENQNTEPLQITYRSCYTACQVRDVHLNSTISNIGNAYNNMDGR